MDGLQSIKIMSYFSLILASLTFVFSFDRGISIGGLIFIWAVIGNTILYYIKNRYVRYGMCVFIMAIPFFFIKSTNDFVASFIIFIASIFYIYKELHNKNYGIFIEEFKRGIIILVGIAIICFFRFKFIVLGNALAPYIIIYLISGITILRTTRLYEYTNDDKIIKKLNLRYSIAITIVSFILSVKVIRIFLLDIWFWTWDIISKIILYITTLAATVIGYIMGIIVDFLRKILSGKVLTPGELESSGKAIKHRVSSKTVIYNPFDNRIFVIIGWIAITGIILYVIIKIFKNKADNVQKLERYKEEKEYIVNDKKSNNKLFKRLSSIIKPKNNNEYIRFYYVKYLKLCLKKDIDVENSDTSLDINIKSREKFNEQIIRSMRMIYIRIRYGNHSADKNTANDFSKYYKELKNEK